MFDLFSDIFARRGNCLQRLDPRTKLMTALAAILCVILSTRPVFPVLILVVCLMTALALGMPVRLIAIRLTAPMGIVLVLLILQSLLHPSASWRVLSLNGWSIRISQDGFHAGLLTCSRVLGAVSVVFLLSSVTPAHQIFHSLRWFRVPQGWVEVALLMYRYIFTLVDITADMVAAQRLRLGYSGVKRSLESAGIVAGTIILRSVDQAAHTHEAMILRGCHGQIPFGRLPPVDRRNRWITALAILLLGCAHLLVERDIFCNYSGHSRESGCLRSKIHPVSSDTALPGPWIPPAVAGRE
ncbi:MAG: cobalt ECF transporter T component CbiQ [Verrucomicrobia bacterium]|nr:cobalt ECF transporter T component CbiQ [Verrucomicrobiota bacterium]